MQINCSKLIVSMIQLKHVRVHWSLQFKADWTKEEWIVRGHSEEVISSLFEWETYWRNCKVHTFTVRRSVHKISNPIFILSNIQGDLSLCENLKVLYLHNNSIKKIANCHNLTNLTHLYLQWNKICEIQNINGLKNLRKLYLGHNLISCLENISELSQLEELHIERQANPKNGWLNFRFEANSLRGIANTLKVLNISGLELTKLSDLQLLKQLRELNACNNQFENAGDLALCLEQMPYLTIVNLKGCPAQKNDRHYRDKIITSCRVLGKTKYNWPCESHL